MPMAVLPLAGAALAGGAALSALGGGRKGARPAQSQSESKGGFQTYPEELRNAYLKQFLPQALAQSQGPYQSTPMGQADTGPFASQGLQQLQQYFNQNGSPFAGGNGAQPLGVVEPFHPYQIQALTQLAQGAGTGSGNSAELGAELAPYQNLYNENVLNPTLESIERQRQIALSGAGSQNTGNLGAQNSSAYGTYLGQLQNDYNNMQRGAQAEGFQSALGLRQQGIGEKRQSLMDLLNSGTAIQEHNQQYLNYLQPQLQAALPQNRTANLGQMLNMIPGESPTSSGTSTGEVAGKPNAAARWGAGLQALGSAGLNYGSFMGQGGGAGLQNLGGGMGGTFGNNLWGGGPQAGSLGSFGGGYGVQPQIPGSTGLGGRLSGGYGGIPGGNRTFNPAYGYR